MPIHANIGENTFARAKCGQELDSRFAGVGAGREHDATNNPYLVTCPACNETDAEREDRIQQEMRIGA